MANTKKSEMAVVRTEVKELTVRVVMTQGLSYVFWRRRGGALKLTHVVVDYAWAETSLSEEARAKHVYTYEAGDCPVVKGGLVLARSAALSAVIASLSAVAS